VIALVLLVVAGVAAGFSETLGPVIRGRVTADGQPVTGATCYAMPGASRFPTTDANGCFELRFSPLDHADEIDVTVVARDGRRTEFGENMVRPGLFGATTVDVDLSGRQPWVAAPVPGR